MLIYISGQCLKAQTTTSHLLRNVVRYNSTLYIPKKEDEYTSTPEYPPILDTSAKAKRKRKIGSWYDLIKRQVTVEEKLIALNLPKYYGWQCVMMKEFELPYNILSHVQFITRTHLIQNSSLPAYYQVDNEKCAKLSAEIKQELEDTMSYEISGVRKNEASSEDENGNKQKELTNIIIQQINRILMKNLSSSENHILSTQVDYNPRIEAFWSVGGQNPNWWARKFQYRMKRKISEDEMINVWNRFFQYVGSPILQLRVSHPLKPVVNYNEVESKLYPVPVNLINPDCYGFELKHRHGTCIPGFWPGDTNEFSLLSYHDCNYIKQRPPQFGEEDAVDTLQSQAILSSYSWLLGLASYQGFSTFHDVTYPFVNQAVLTDGKQFSFSVYQLNTTLLYDEYAVQNEKSNICWITPPQMLYEKVEDGRLIGLNEEVLKMLISFYINRPKVMSDAELKPYLGVDIKRVQDFEHTEKRAWLERQFKHIYANRPRHRLTPEIYDWELIYKVWYDTRPLEAKRRFFERKENPWKRRLDDCHPEYIPKCIREDKHLTKKKQKKFRDMFWPK